MSAYNTLYITESKAKQLLFKKLYGDVSFETLEKFMDELLEPRLYNARIVPDGSENDNNEVGD